MSEQEANALIDQKAAAKLLGMKTRTLESWRFRGVGPKWVRVGRKSVRYRVRDLQVFLERGE